MQASYIEFDAADAAKCSTFLADLLGWTSTPMGASGDGWFDAGPMRAGLHGAPSPETVLYFSVPELEASIEKVRTWTFTPNNLALKN